MLVELGGALEALVRKLALQREIALSACTLGPRAEEIAKRARLVAFGRGRVPPTDLAELTADIDGLAAEANAIVAQIQNGATLTGDFATAIADHVVTLAAISRDPAALADKANLHAALGSLADTVRRQSGGREAKDSSSAALRELVARSQGFADRAARIAAQDVTDLREAVLSLSRDLREFADHAVTVAAAIHQDAETGERALAKITSGIGSVGDAPGAAPPETSALKRIAGLIRGSEASGSAITWSRS
jgi:hypothetical protein